MNTRYNAILCYFTYFALLTAVINILIFFPSFGKMWKFMLFQIFSFAIRANANTNILFDVDKFCF